ncbi:MAG: LysR substrate-binding domain-containing protein [Opitutaceae bacterium]
MELRHLRYFVVLAKELNFRRAAEVLRVASPSLSKQIKDLEHELEARLFDRNTKKVKLTSAGVVFLEQAEALLTKANEAVLAVRGAVGGHSGKLALGILGPVSGEFLPATLSRFAQTYPHVDISLKEIGPDDQIAQLENKQIQIAFTFNQARDPVIPHLEHHVILERDPIVLLSRFHALAAKKSIKISELAQDTMLCLSDNVNHGRHAALVKDIFQKHALKPAKIKHMNSFESMYAFMICNQGVTMGPKLYRVSPPPGIVERPIQVNKSDHKYQIRAVWLKNETSAPVKNFIDALKLETGLLVRPT